MTSRPLPTTPNGMVSLVITASGERAVEPFPRKNPAIGMVKDPLDTDWAVRIVHVAISTGFRSEVGEAAAIPPAGVAELRIYQYQLVQRFYWICTHTHTHRQTE